MIEGWEGVVNAWRGAFRWESGVSAAGAGDAGELQYAVEHFQVRANLPDAIVSRRGTQLFPQPSQQRPQPLQTPDAFERADSPNFSDFRVSGPFL